MAKKLPLKKKNNVGRPNEYTQEKAREICEMLSMGISLRTICITQTMPAISTVFKWMRENEEFSKQYAQAKQESAEAWHEELAELGDEAIRLSQTVDSKASGAVVQAVKLKADNIKWMMSKMKPKKYGDKIDMTTNGKDIPTPILGGVTKK